MNYLRFSFGLAILVLALVIYNFVVEPFAMANILIPIVRAIGVMTIGLVWGLIFWTPIRLIRGADLAPDLQQFAFYTAALFVAIYMLYHLIF